MNGTSEQKLKHCILDYETEEIRQISIMWGRQMYEGRVVFKHMYELVKQYFWVDV